MNIVVAGGSGLIGTALIRQLSLSGHTVTVLTRDPARTERTLGKNVSTVMWDGASAGPWEKTLDGADAVFNLAGETLDGGRWTLERKKILVDSRVNATRSLVQAIGGATKKPSVLVNASAVGYYGNVPEGDVDETADPGNDFLAMLCKSWEDEAARADLLGVRVACIRTGLVLAPNGGALARMLPAFKMFVGGPLGGGKQWWPWIHIDDEIGIMMHALENAAVHEGVNATAPAPVRMKDFAAALGRQLGRPSILPAPGFALRLVFGEMADCLLLIGQRAVPKKALETGYVFKYTSLDVALKNLLG